MKERERERERGGGRLGLEVAVNHVGPQKAAGKVHNSFNVMSISLHISTDQPFFERHTPFLWLAVDCINALLVRFSVSLYHYKHVRPFGVNDGLTGVGEEGEEEEKDRLFGHIRWCTVQLTAYELSSFINTLTCSPNFVSMGLQMWSIF